MNTKILLTATSVVLGAAGLLALFAPELVVGVSPLPKSLTLLLVQLLGGLYLAFAATDWLARTSPIGGVYARPISLGNFAHFIVGALVLAKQALGAVLTLPLIIALIVYAVLAVVFGWLVFVATGLPAKPPAPPKP